MEALKKRKTDYEEDEDELPDLCLEFYTPHQQEQLAFYLVLLGDNSHYFLNNTWKLIPNIDDDTLEEYVFYTELHSYPEFEDIQMAKRELDPRVFDVLFNSYVKTLADYVEFDTIPPSYILESILTPSLLIEHFHKCVSRANRDACLRILFSLFNANLHWYKYRFTFNYVNEATCILAWKGCINCENYYTIYSSIDGQEQVVLKLLACARNRPNGNNSFAQMPKDILFGLIFPLIKWSLPFLVPRFLSN